MRCRVEVAALRAEPLDAAEQVTQALLHEPLEVVEERDGWARVRTAYAYPGWVRAEALEGGRGRLPDASGATPIEEARRFLGAPYQWGGLTRTGIDCSGLVHLAYRLAFGRLVPRDSWQQERSGAVVAGDDVRPGDLVTYGSGDRADHVAFWLGDGKILHSTARDDLGVVEELEPSALQEMRRAVVRL
jgi:cell wall-associated NlpC family hydrolase